MKTAVAIFILWPLTRLSISSVMCKIFSDSLSLYLSFVIFVSPKEFSPVIGLPNVPTSIRLALSDV